MAKRAVTGKHRLSAFHPPLTIQMYMHLLARTIQSTVTLIANFYPAQDPGGGPNFYRFANDHARYRLHIDNDGDAEHDIRISWKFDTVIQNDQTFLYNTGPITSLDDPDFNIRQYYTLEIKNLDTGDRWLYQDLPVPPVNIGPASTPDYEYLASQAVHDLGDGRKVFAGQRDDPFYVDLGAIFDLLTIRPGAPGNSGGGIDGLSGFNCNTVAIQLPISDLTYDGLDANRSS